MSNPKIKDKLVEIIEAICEPKHIHFDEPGDAPDGCVIICLLYTSPSPRDATLSRMPSSA